MVSKSDKPKTGRKDNLEKSERSANKKLVGEKRTWERKEKVIKTGMCEESVSAQPKKRDSKGSKFPSYLLIVNIDSKGGRDAKKPFKKGSKSKEPEAPIQTRRQKQKISDQTKTLRLNYNQLLMKKKEKGPEVKELKHSLVGKSIEAIGDKWIELCYKHDGSRILQSLLKFGNRVHRATIVNALKDNFVELATSKYAHYLASKMYYYAPENEQKAHLRAQMTGQMSKLVQHAFAAETLEFVYCRCTETEQRELVLSFYGNYFLLMKETVDD